MSRFRSYAVVLSAVALMGISASPAAAQLNGENLLGDNGVRSGTQALPGFFTGSLVYGSYADTVKDPNGNRITFDPSQPASQRINVVAPLAGYVSKRTFLGGHYGVMAVMPFASGVLEAPAFGFTETASANVGDLYVVPFQLGWHFRRADVITAFGFFAPTGHYVAGGSGNIGKGMWSYEVSGGATVYFDKARTWSLAGTAFWETHSKKEGTSNTVAGPVTLTGVRVGQLLTVEGGAAKSFKHGAASIGVAYYAQWKITADDLGFPEGLPDALTLGKHRVFGIGPDVTIPIATKRTLVSLINVRYLWEAGAQAKTQGQSLVITWTAPVPGIKIPARN